MNTKISKKRTNEYVSVHLHDREVTWNESASDSFDPLLLLATMVHRSISLILSTFEDVLVSLKHNYILRIKAKFSLAFIRALILLLGSFLLLARRSGVWKKKWLHSLLIPPKHENTSGLNDSCST